MSESRFEFGRNWQDYIDRHFSPERAETSRQHLLGFLGIDRLEGRTFLDIGSGSGLHSLAAFQSGAAQVISFDYDPHSVAATQCVRKFAGEPEHWSVQQGSVLDPEFMATLPLVDIVYSWGVLHHTGDVWEAIQQAAAKVRPGGLLYLALYSSNVHIDPPPEFWLDVKRRYVSSSWLGQRLTELWYIWRFDMGQRPWRIVNVFRKIRACRKSRGMSYYNDIRDWVGGWPMEFCRDEDVTRFVEKLGFQQSRIRTGEANSEFLFVRSR